jgi:hypothetical protein
MENRLLECGEQEPGKLDLDPRYIVDRARGRLAFSSFDRIVRWFHVRILPEETPAKS